jgi:4-carboxymuconolactone decarboxylase
MTTEKERELERTTAMRGFRYGLHDFLAEMDLELLKRHNDSSDHYPPRDSLLDAKTKELLTIAVCVAQIGWVSHLQVHIHAAHRAGASPEEILEAIHLIGGPSGSPGHARGVEAWRATFRPDIPPVERVAELA